MQTSEEFSRKTKRIMRRNGLRHPLKYARFRWVILRIRARTRLSSAWEYLATLRRNPEPDECIDWDDDDELAHEYGFGQGT